ncbi:MAG TPA: MerR family transcriptional regulator [Candidatus Eisenbacteria bacterium]|nr:MerR family transcriptional regulator [Candidatus Eisenbacteria bacterium]
MKSLPQGKLYYSISEVSDLVGVKPHVLRYWETQFKMLRPRKGRGGARMYRKRDVEALFDIKQLLYDQRFTIEGAKRKLLDERVSEKDQMGIPFARLDKEEAIRGLRDDLRELLDFLRHDSPAPRGRSRRSS